MLCSELPRIFTNRDNGEPVSKHVMMYTERGDRIYLYDAELVSYTGERTNKEEDVLAGCVLKVPFVDAVRRRMGEMRIETSLWYALVWEEEVWKWFDEYGQFLAHFPEACIQECAAAGYVEPVVKRWRQLLNFEVPIEKSIQYLVEFGCWSEKELEGMTPHKRAERCLWVACGDILEERNRRRREEDIDWVSNWIGLIH